MAFARVVAFEEVDRTRIEERKRSLQEDERPEDIPASEVILLHDPENEKALVLLFFDSEEDYRRGDETLGAMPASETPGRRTSVGKYEVAVRRAG